ncbi:RNA-binding protein MEX3B-like [Ylistrum balloti]|uniref:RNA-binding protein MEX3B-like n=1 Tax=Ylistrum balloti TaxID=509963 RepID=UPI002905B5D0|nr:RNA-binding protein MEX3B-like [Ylistrum balloti]
MADVGSILKCADCGVLFFSRQAFLQHECHKALNSIKTEGHVTENDHIRTMFQCEKCKGWFWDEEIYAKHACQQLHESSQSNEGDASAAESSTSSSSCGPTSTAGQEKESCCICMENPANCVLLDCGHLVTCMNCGGDVERCPICRAEIKRRVKVFTC